MPLVFSYGQLQRADVQERLFGRRFEARRDELPGHARETVTIDGAQEANVRPHPTSSVAGVVLDITDDELARADEYELPYGYKRIALRLASGLTAWVYVHG